MGWVVLGVCVSQLQILLCLHHKPLVNLAVNDLAVNDLAIAVNFEIVPLIHNFVSGPVVKCQFYQYYHITNPTHHTITCDMWISHVLHMHSYPHHNYCANSHVDTTQCS